jgi:exopolysaccharide production protein ExoQ
MISIKIKRTDLEKKIDWLEKAMVVFFFFYYSKAVFALLVTSGASEGSGIDTTNANWALFNLGFIFSYLFSAFFLILRWERVLFVIRQASFYLPLLVLMAPLSYIWSVNPEETLSGSIGMVGSTLVALYIATRFSIKEQVHLLGISFGISVALSFVFAVALPKYGMEHFVHAGAVRGVYTHKNGLGMAMVLALGVFLAQPKNTKWPWLGIIGSAILIILSQSANALINGVMIAAVFIALNTLLSLRPNLFMLTITSIILITWASSFYWEDAMAFVLSLVGKDPTFTGRTDIWSFSFHKIMQRPFLGYGFNAFWTDKRLQKLVLDILQWEAPNSHNGYLDFIIQLGFIGFSLYVTSLLILLKNAFLLARSQLVPSAMWPFMLSVWMISVNFAESDLLSQNSLVWLLFVSLYFTVSMELHRSNVERRVRKSLEADLVKV